MGLIVIQEWWGLNENICKTTDELAALGFTAIAVDIYRGGIAKNHEVCYDFYCSRMQGI